MRGRPRKVEPVQEISPAQDLANRIWEGQSVSLHRDERIRRVRIRLIDKGMDPDSVVIG